MNIEEELIVLNLKQQRRKKELDLSLECEREALKAESQVEKKEWMKKAQEHAQKARLLRN
jgi:hypothetical protein